MLRARRVLLLALLGAAAWLRDAAAGELQGVDLNKESITKTLNVLPPDAKVALELYATWCPACRAFKPEYEKAVRFLRGASKVHAFRLDCAVDPDVCGRYAVSAYPTILAGPAADMAAANVAALSKFDYSKFSRNAPGVVKFVAQAFKLDLAYVEQPAGDSDGSHAAAAGPATASVPWAAADVQLATLQLVDAITASRAMHSSEEQRAALLLLLQVWAGAHPLPACRAGSAAAMRQLPGLWPAGEPQPSGDLRSLAVCGSSACGSGGGASCAPGAAAAAAGAAAAAAAGSNGSSSSGSSSSGSALQWQACRGSIPDSRGFTCGLWLLFHTTAARVPEADGGALLVSSLKGFGRHFFQCQVCKSHFTKITDSPEAAAVRSRRDAMLWLWRAHNEVNARLAVIEAKYGSSSTGDPRFPKALWPTAAECPQCRLPALDAGAGAAQAAVQAVQWNEEETYLWLARWYGAEPAPAARGAAGGERLAQAAAPGGGGAREAAASRDVAAAAAAAGGGGPAGGGALLPQLSRLGLLAVVASLACLAWRRCSGSGGAARRHAKPSLRGLHHPHPHIHSLGHHGLGKLHPGSPWAASNGRG